jgi:hypothetical protein
MAKAGNQEWTVIICAKLQHEGYVRTLKLRFDNLAADRKYPWGVWMLCTKHVQRCQIFYTE